MLEIFSRNILFITKWQTGSVKILKETFLFKLSNKLKAKNNHIQKKPRETAIKLIQLIKPHSFD